MVRETGRVNRKQLRGLQHGRFVVGRELDVTMFNEKERRQVGEDPYYELAKETMWVWWAE